MIDCSTHDRGEGVRKKIGCKNFATAGGHNQDVIGPQFDVLCLSGDYLLNVYSGFFELWLPGDLVNDPRLIQLRRASESAC